MSYEGDRPKLRAGIRHLLESQFFKHPSLDLVAPSAFVMAIGGCQLAETGLLAVLQLFVSRHSGCHYSTKAQD